MQRLLQLEIVVRDDDPETIGPLETILVGEQAKEWLRDHCALGDDPRAEQERCREVSLVLMAARDNHVDRACTNPDCEACQVFERGFALLLNALPERYQRVVKEYTILNHAVTSALGKGVN